MDGVRRHKVHFEYDIGVHWRMHSIGYSAHVHTWRGVAARKDSVLFQEDADQGLVEHSLVSQCSTKLAVKRLVEAGNKTLYRHAMHIDNLAFAGWVMEADAMQRGAVGPHRSTNFER